jgi:hypothetical protein
MKEGGVNQEGKLIKGGINEIKQGGNLEGPIPYGITWRLVLMKVLPQPPRPIRIHMPK